MTDFETRARYAASVAICDEQRRRFKQDGDERLTPREAADLAIDAYQRAWEALAEEHRPIGSWLRDRVGRGAAGSEGKQQSDG